MMPLPSTKPRSGECICHSVSGEASMKPGRIPALRSNRTLSYDPCTLASSGTLGWRYVIGMSDMSGVVERGEEVQKKWKQRETAIRDDHVRWSRRLLKIRAAPHVEIAILMVGGSTGLSDLETFDVLGTRSFS